MVSSWRSPGFAPVSQRMQQLHWLHVLWQVYQWRCIQNKRMERIFREGLKNCSYHPVVASEIQVTCSHPGLNNRKGGRNNHTTLQLACNGLKNRVLVSTTLAMVSKYIFLFLSHKNGGHGHKLCVRQPILIFNLNIVIINTGVLQLVTFTSHSEKCRDKYRNVGCKI